MRQPFDRAQSIAAGAGGRETVTQAGGDVDHTGPSVERENLDVGGTLRIGAGQDFATAAMAQQVLRQFGDNDGNAASLGFVIAQPGRKPDDPPAGVSDIGGIADDQGFHGAISNARW